VSLPLEALQFESFRGLQLQHCCRRGCTDHTAVLYLPSLWRMCGLQSLNRTNDGRLQMETRQGCTADVVVELLMNRR